MTTITIHASFLPFEDADESLAFYRDVLGFEVRNDVGYAGMRWITVGPPNQPDTSIVLQPAVVDPCVSDDERAAISAMMAKRTFAGIVLGTDDLDALFERVQASGADVIQEPIDQDYGIRDCGVRDPAGNQLRIQQVL